MLKHADVLEKLTLEEKAALCSGADFWHLKNIAGLDLQQIMVCDGPHGLRKQGASKENVGLSNSFPAVCYPTAATSACSWDPALLEEMGKSVADEALKERVSVVLGPGANMKRSPLCGRNFEYFSEDPFLAGRLAGAFIIGVQSKGVGTSLKHFAANSQETRRMTVSAVVDERTLREIYLPAYEYAVKTAQPWTVMNAYNRVNGTYCSENEWLQNKVLRDEWGFEGMVVSDWGAVNNRARGVKNGNDLEMPFSGGYNDRNIVKAVESGELSEDDLDKAVDRVVDLIIKSQPALQQNHSCDMEQCHATARKVACESMVLLKNEDSILPLDKSKKIAVIGSMAKQPRYQGAGSSQINPTRIDNAYDSLQELGYELTYAKGYDDNGIEAVLIDQAKVAAAKADVVLAFIGLTPEYESEGYDRAHMKLPETHNRLVKALAEVNPNLVVVLAGGAPVEMPWIDSVKGVLHTILSGQAGGSAAARILAGKVNPSGKLAETYPLSLEDNPSYRNFPGNRVTVEYREGIFIGYRYYDTADKPVLFPFGFGLSYTQFEYGKLKLSKKKITDADELTVTFTVKNTGGVDGAEIAQLYVKDEKSTIFRPEKELKGFQKVFLKAGEETEITLTLDKRSFAFYNTAIHDWCVESGSFEILIGASSRDIRLSAKVKVDSTRPDAVIPDFKESAPAYYAADINGITDSQFEAVLGTPIPSSVRDSDAPITFESSLEDAADTAFGKKVLDLIIGVVNVAFKNDKNRDMIIRTMVELPIRNMVSMSLGVFSEEMANGLIDMMNGGKKTEGFKKILKGIPHAVLNIKDLLQSI